MNESNQYPDLAANTRRRIGRGMKHWTYEIPVPLTADLIKPFQLLFVRSKSLISAAITYFEGTGGKRAWVSHVGQILANGWTVSEANWPEHSFTPIDYYLDLQRAGEVRLTLTEIIPGTWGEHDFLAKVACEHYHAGIGRDMRAELAKRGLPVPGRYELAALFPMMITSIARGLIPWTGSWTHIPQEYEAATFICSGIVDWGWAEGQRLINRDIFPSTLSGTVPSPQDMLDSPAVRYVAGTKKVYLD